jgi:hypothetical protein
MPYQNIDAVIAPADVAAINAAIGTIRSKLPFLVSIRVNALQTRSTRR